MRLLASLDALLRCTCRHESFRGVFFVSSSLFPKAQKLATQLNSNVEALKSVLSLLALLVQKAQKRLDSTQLSSTQLKQDKTIPFRPEVNWDAWK
jgi:hypothetical protein